MTKKGILIIFLLMICAISAVFFSAKPTAPTQSIPAKNFTVTTTAQKEYTAPKAPSGNNGTENYVKGVWVATVYNIDFPSTTNLTVDEIKKEIDQIAQNCREMGFNTVFFQVRPCADAFYNSKTFPTSKFLTGRQGNSLPNDFDVLEYFVTIAHSNGLKLHAWINPLRVTLSDGDILSESNPAYENPWLLMKDKTGKSYFDPGYAEARNIIIEGVKEIVQNYQVDGIHFDDYFYPENLINDSYSKYAGDLTARDFRRSNINSLIRETYTAVKSINPEVEFGVSPSGIWKNFTTDSVKVKGNQSYYNGYADSVYWMENRIVDYICPQIYWSGTAQNTPYDAIAKWWQSQAARTDTKLYIGHALYKTVDTAEASAEFDIAEIDRQISLNKTLESCSGSVFFSYSDALRQKSEIKRILDN